MVRKWKVTRGTGMASREENWVSLTGATVGDIREDPDVRAGLDNLARRRGLHGWLDDLARDTESTLRDAGLPYQAGVWHECGPGGSFRVIPGQERRDPDNWPPPPGCTWTSDLRTAVQCLGKEEYSYEDYVAWALDVVHEIREALGNDNGERACLRCLDLGSIVTECRLVTDKGPMFDHGMRFHSDGPKAPRRDALNRLIDEAFAILGLTATAAQVLDYIRADSKTVQEVGEEEYEIYWQDDRGRDRMTAFKSFQNRVSSRRKKLQEQ